MTTATTVAIPAPAAMASIQEVFSSSSALV
jgi:hypothetical protein